MYFSGCHEPDELSCVSAWILRTVLVSNGHLMMIFEIFHAFRSGWYFISRPPQGVSKCTPPWKVKSRRDDAGMLQKQHKRSGSSSVCQFYDSKLLQSRICSRRPWLHLDANTFHLTQTMKLESKPMLRKWTDDKPPTRPCTSMGTTMLVCTTHPTQNVEKRVWSWFRKQLRGIQIARSRRIPKAAAEAIFICREWGWQWSVRDHTNLPKISFRTTQKQVSN